MCEIGAGQRAALNALPARRIETHEIRAACSTAAFDDSLRNLGNYRVESHVSILGWKIL